MMYGQQSSVLKQSRDTMKKKKRLHYDWGCVSLAVQRAGVLFRFIGAAQILICNV